MEVDIVNFIKSTNHYLVLLTPIATALSSAYIIFIGLRRLFRKKSRHEKYMILSSRERNTSDGKETYILTENEHIKLLLDEVEKLKIENNALAKQLANTKFVSLMVMVGVLVAVWLRERLHKQKKSDSDKLKESPDNNDSHTNENYLE